MSPSFWVKVSEKENYKNEINESTIFDCGVLEGGCCIQIVMVGGRQIIDRCNITSNRVNQDIGGYDMQGISSDSFIKYTTIRSNNQSTSDSFGLCYHQSSNSDKLISAISCSYAENRQLNTEGRLIATATKLSMFDCCILLNEFTYTFYLWEGSLVFNNSFADKYTATSQANSVEYINTFSSSECKYYYFDINENENKVNNKDDEDDSDDIEKVKRIVRYLDRKSNFIQFI
ncbi:hypothetical protein TVAG_417880 [Trichomonas vaginalis G3]|uniref:Right handed beta helix domain-containing protein n=1 Tax=Trichomonas vaginalis (strain ATCC PRA-98 / G3) TaxID=412133 RepID=A2EDA8_TRIV3|nr:hypothetical protein TVAGG3_0876110 [Trichomonas vaginalis G3]EAY09366.1 hypothetical protein TVAG_417880 [Trichomonas vaginalis G3]KAI5501698.1 hypothetical protein TVAGG3_0876110 [Trichomonas vaginalis G3]|eukprot:XP_001321589.1 hypothetical protein [Trichomonas vaginalis G3]